MARFINDILHIRYFKFRIGRLLFNCYRQSEGVPQGSVRSLTLFIIAIYDIPAVLRLEVSSTLYADS